MADKKQFNMKNPAVKRILQEIKEMQKDSGKEYMSMPIEEDIFEWQFAIHGPPDTEFEGGIYHGRIILPPEYPFKPPAFMLLSPSGRFEVQTKICLSISQHHPEHWQPSWSVRTALVALIAFMPTKPDGALGSLDYTKEERRALAIKSRMAAPKFGSLERQKVINQIHEEMLQTAPPVPELIAPATSEVFANKEGGSVEDVKNASDPGAENSFPNSLNIGEMDSMSVKAVAEGMSSLTRTPARSEVVEQSQQFEAQSSENLPNAAGHVAASDGIPSTNTVMVSALGVTAPSTSGILESRSSRNAHTVDRKQRRDPSKEDRALTMLAMALIVAIIALLVRKFLKVYGKGTEDTQSI